MLVVQADRHGDGEVVLVLRIYRFAVTPEVGLRLDRVQRLQPITSATYRTHEARQ